MNKGSKNNILKKMRIVGIVLSVLFICIVIFFVYILKLRLEEDVQNDLLNDALIVSKEVDRYFIKYSEIVNQMRTNELLVAYIKDVSKTGDIYSHPDHKMVMQTLKSIKDTDSEINYVWIAIDSANTLVTDNPEWEPVGEFNIYERPWYERMKQADSQISFTGPYTGSGSQDYIASIVTSVKDNGEIIGSVAIDIKIKNISDFVSNYQIGQDGFAFLMTDENQLILPLEGQENGDNKISKPFDILSKGINTSIVKYSDNALEDYYLAHSYVPINGWEIGSVIPISETRDLIGIVNIMTSFIVISLVAIILIFEIVIRLSDNLEEMNDLYGLLKKQEKRISEIAFIDPLTEIPNRRNFVENVKKSIDSEESGAVILLDIDNFKEINDTFGHIFGDEVLKEVSNCLKNIQSEEVFISRFGGDEFLIHLRGYTQEAEVDRVIFEVINLLHAPIIVNKEEIYVGASIGVTRYPIDSKDVNQLIINSDLAMYHVKETGKNNYAYFEKKLTDKLNEKAFIEKNLRKVLDEKNLRLVYQPQIEVSSGDVIGAEALLRIEGDLISPSKFIPVAEESGMIIDIGRRVTKEVIEQLAKLSQIDCHIKPVSINFSAKQLRDETYVQFLANLLKTHSIDPKLIDIEITESFLLEGKEKTLEYLHNLKSLGVSISLDDFGTGYSSLNYLTYLPVDKIKLDKSLSDKFLVDTDVTVIENIIALAHSLSLKVVAEGIESKEQVLQLRKFKCDYIQGFYFSKPREVDELCDLMGKNYSEL